MHSSTKFIIYYTDVNFFCVLEVHFYLNFFYLFESSNINLKNLIIVNKSNIVLIPKGQMVFFEFLSSSYGKLGPSFFIFI